MPFLYERGNYSSETAEGIPAHCATAASKRARYSEQRQAARQAHSSSATSLGAASIGRAQQCGGGGWSRQWCVRPSEADSRSTWSERPVGRRRSGPAHNQKQHPGHPPQERTNATPQRFSSKQHPTDPACSAAPGPSPTSPRQRPHPPNQGQGQGRAHLGHPPPPPQ